MRKTLFYLIILIAFIGCEKEDDDSDMECTSDCTTLSGRVVTSGNLPLKGIKIQLKYIKSSFLYYHSWLKRDATTDANGCYSMSFNIKDNEVESFEGNSSSFFELQIDLNNLDPDKYFLPEHISETDTSYSWNPIVSLKRDTAYYESLYIPTKDYITVTLKNFHPTHKNDHFEVQTFFPWGTKTDEIKMLNTEYGITSSGYDNFVAENEIQTFRNVPVARNDTNIVRIIKVKNGVALPEDHKIFIPNNNKIKLSFDY